jgi:hypothetical protein
MASTERQSPHAGENHQTRTVGWRQLRPFLGGALQDTDLVSEREVLQFHSASGPEHGPQCSEQY